MRPPRTIPAPVTWPAHSAHIRAGAEPVLPDNTGETRLHAAAESGTVEVLLHLLASGADLNSKNKVGITPLQRAAFFGRPEVLKLLLAAAYPARKNKGNYLVDSTRAGSQVARNMMVRDVEGHVVGHRLNTMDSANPLTFESRLALLNTVNYRGMHPHHIRFY